MEAQNEYDNQYYVHTHLPRHTHILASIYPKRLHVHDKKTVQYCIPRHINLSRVSTYIRIFLTQL